jgi:hypothetical protein
MEDYKKVINALEDYIILNRLDDALYLISGEMFFKALREDNKILPSPNKIITKVNFHGTIGFLSYLPMLDDVRLYSKLKGSLYPGASMYPSIITPDRKIINYPYNDIKKS